MQSFPRSVGSFNQEEAKVTAKGIASLSDVERFLVEVEVAIYNRKAETKQTKTACQSMSLD